MMSYYKKTFLLTLCLLVVEPGFTQIYKQVDSQTDFWRPAGLAGHGILSIASDSQGNIFAGTGDSGLFRSLDQGESWLNVKNLPERFEAIAVGRNGFVYAEAFRSTDEGMSWSGMPLPPHASPFFQAIHVAPNGDIYIGVFDSDNFTGGLIYRSSDDGENWEDINDGLDSTLASSLLQHSFGILFAGSAWMNIFIDRIDPPNQWFFKGGLRKSIDTGRTWIHLSGLYDEGVSTLKEDSSGRLFAGTGTHGMYRSDDTGSTWLEVNAGLFTRSQKAISSMIINPRGHIFIATYGGVFESSDNGDHWIARNEGLADTTVWSMTIDSAGYLYVGTLSGIYRSIQSTSSVEHLGTDLPNQISLSQNYPNPFNPTTIINYSVPKPTHVKIIIYDVLGSEIATLVNERKQPGEYKVTWNAEGMSSGIYVYRLIAGEFIETKKMVVIR